MSGWTRRQWGAVLGVGVVALGAGAGLQVRRTRQADAEAVAASAAAASAAAVAAAGPLPGPLHALDGRTLAAADVAGRAVVLNFWAPWCPPCVREMPELDRFSKSPAAKDTLVIGLAIDEQPAVEKFLAGHPVGFPVVVLGYAGLSWVRKLSEDTNVALPFSALYDRAGRLARRKFGPTDAAELTGWVQRA